MGCDIYSPNLQLLTLPQTPLLVPQVKQQLLQLEGLQESLAAREADFRTLRETYSKQFEAAQKQVSASGGEVKALSNEVQQLQVRAGLLGAKRIFDLNMILGPSVCQCVVAVALPRQGLLMALDLEMMSAECLWT